MYDFVDFSQMGMMVSEVKNVTGHQARNQISRASHVTRDCVSYSHKGYLIFKTLVNITEQQIPSIMAKNPFKPRTPRKQNASTHHKTVMNRNYDLMKQGIEIAHHRDDGAFRVAKSRMLKKLRTGANWCSMNPEEREEAEENAIVELEAKREAKKRTHEIEWRTRIDNGELDEEIEGVVEVDEEEDGMMKDNELSRDGWITCSDDENIEYEDIPTFDSDNVSNAFMGDFEQIKSKAGEEWLLKMKIIEEAAEKRERELRDHILNIQK